MALLQAPHPDSEVAGAPVLGVLTALGDEARPFMEKHGLVDVTPEGWYPLQSYYDLLRDIMENSENLTTDMVSAGIRAAEIAYVPPEVATVEQILSGFEDTYQHHHRNADTAWVVEHPDEKTFILTDSSGYPPDLTYGIIYGFVRRLAGEQEFSLSYQDLTDRTSETKTSVTYIVELE